ncbi:hypothetical protein HPE56_19200 [Maribacter sp. ANRC-HE7]|uniref:Uncharacterized protein n=1 Tax=Maribacter aquimaris TaxID=2737171 RepID=A0ABR7V9K4_9FLAO|nr:hypothetical protein [Maribacter aquimaris]MBD0779931.1 hypothetical protein [Maribacter aquimaris]
MDIILIFERLDRLERLLTANKEVRTFFLEWPLRELLQKTVQFVAGFELF